MAQSDFIKYKKLWIKLKENQLPHVLTSQDFILYKQFALENKTIHSKTNYNHITPANKNIVFDIETNTLEDGFSSDLCKRGFH